MVDPRPDPAHLVELLGMKPHPEGGHFVETWKHGTTAERPAGTAIYFLLRAGEVSHWHRVDSAEIWHHYAGDSLVLSSWTDTTPVERRVLGVDFDAGERPQLVVAPGEWQSARTLGEWTLVGCTVSPGFDFAHFELARPGWEPPTFDGHDRSVGSTPTSATDSRFDPTQGAAP
ncbi:cupin domain-containing protein [Ilumatobacter sp.]|uniref:cupin domain-containing protein n=1 Tax=Ilumatobacter sp. TaxID=1967498 RepID=UPI003C58E944